MLLPEPLGPTMNANRPRSIRQLSPRRASTHRVPLRYDFQTFTTFDHRVTSMRPEPDRLHGNEPGRAPGGIEPAERSHDDRQADAQRQQRGRHAQVHARR